MKQWHETREVLDRLAELAREGKRAALATVVRVRGSAYRHEGAKLLVGEDGSTTGNVSGGCLEQDVREVALQVIRVGRPSSATTAPARTRSRPGTWGCGARERSRCSSNRCWSPGRGSGSCSTDGSRSS